MVKDLEVRETLRILSGQRADQTRSDKKCGQGLDKKQSYDTKEMNKVHLQNMNNVH